MNGAVFSDTSLLPLEASSSNIDIDIPIDPALGGPQVQHVVEAVESDVQEEEAMQVEVEVEPQRSHHHHNPYDQGPQGDPFAVQPSPIVFFAPPELEPGLCLAAEEQRQTPKPTKRKRKPKREVQCGFCEGNDEKNKDDLHEPMLSCDSCGRSGHPSCMNLENHDQEKLRNSWKCTECKLCENCMKKGDEDRLLFCDSCDHAWHSFCLTPVLDGTLPDRWFCPDCPLQSGDEDEADAEGGTEDDGETSEPRIHVVYKSGKKKKKRGRPPRPRPTDITRRRGPGRPPKHRPVEEDEEVEEEEEEEDVDIPTSPRKRLRVRLRLPSRKGKEREDEEPKGMFDDLLKEDERDTSNTTVTNADIQRFQRSRDISDSKLTPRALPPPPLLSRISEPPDTPGPSSRPLRSNTNITASPTPTTPTPNPVSVDWRPLALRIRSIRFGPFDIKTWYDAPFPEEYANIPDGCLWICEYCLKYMKSEFGAARHRTKCKMRHPPGDEIYRDGSVSIFEVDGRKNKIYCQNLCLLSKMYLDHKSLFYDVEPFLFYVMTEVDDNGAHFVGYFSKEKRSPKDYNVSCIMTLPVRQRKGWGNLLIDFSYLLSKKEKRTGSPEKPLSGLGALGYKNYWTLSLMRYLESAPTEGLLLEDISAATSMTIEDIHTTLVQQGMILQSTSAYPPVRPSPRPGQSIKFSRGRKSGTGVVRRHLQRSVTMDSITDKSNGLGTFVPPTDYEIRWDPHKVDAYLTNWESKGYLTLKPEKLKWSPFLGGTRKTEAVGAVDTDKLAEASRAAHLAGEGQGGGRTLFDDDVVVNSPAPNLFTPTPELEMEPLFTPPPDSTSSPNPDVLKDITSQKSLEDTPIPIKRRGRPPRKTEAQKLAEEAAKAATRGLKPRGRPKKEKIVPVQKRPTPPSSSSEPPFDVKVEEQYSRESFPSDVTVCGAGVGVVDEKVPGDVEMFGGDPVEGEEDADGDYSMDEEENPL